MLITPNFHKTTSSFFMLFCVFVNHGFICKLKFKGATHKIVCRANKKEIQTFEMGFLLIKNLKLGLKHTFMIFISLLQAHVIKLRKY